MIRLTGPIQSHGRLALPRSNSSGEKVTGEKVTDLFFTLDIGFWLESSCGEAAVSRDRILRKINMSHFSRCVRAEGYYPRAVRCYWGFVKAGWRHRRIVVNCRYHY